MYIVSRMITCSGWLLGFRGAVILKQCAKSQIGRGPWNDEGIRDHCCTVEQLSRIDAWATGRRYLGRQRPWSAWDRRSHSIFETIGSHAWVHQWRIVIMTAFIYDRRYQYRRTVEYVQVCRQYTTWIRYEDPDHLDISPVGHL
jgi:hypothetical protein